MRSRRVAKVASGKVASGKPSSRLDHGTLIAGVHFADDSGVMRERRILKLSDYHVDDGADAEIDLVTAVDVAIRDLREISMGL